MPLYEYKCEKCGDVFEVIEKFSDEPLTKHEKCGGQVHRLLSTSALQFKGSGWYVNDYAKGKTGENGGKKSDSSPAATPAAPDSGSAPAKTPPSTESKSSSTDSKS